MVGSIGATPLPGASQHTARVQNAQKQEHKEPERKVDQVSNESPRKKIFLKSENLSELRPSEPVPLPSSEKRGILSTAAVDGLKKVIAEQAGNEVDIKNIQKIGAEDPLTEGLGPVITPEPGINIKPFGRVLDIQV